MQLAPSRPTHSLRAGRLAALLTAAAVGACAPGRADAPPEPATVHTWEPHSAHDAPAHHHQQLPIRVEHERVDKDGAAGELVVRVYRVRTFDLPLEVDVTSDDPAIVFLDPGPVALPDREGVDTLRFPWVRRGTPTLDARVRVTGETPGAGFAYDQPAGFVPAPPAPAPSGLTLDVPSIHNDGSTDTLPRVEPVALPPNLNLPRPSSRAPRPPAP